MRAGAQGHPEKTVVDLDDVADKAKELMAQMQKDMLGRPESI